MLYKYFCSLRRKVTSEGSVSSDSDIDCNSWEDDSKVDSSSDDDSVGDMYAEEVEAERLYAVEISSRPDGDVLVEISATEVDSCDASDTTLKEDGGTVATAAESVGNTSFGSASTSTPALCWMLPPLLCRNW